MMFLQTEEHLMLTIYVVRSTEQLKPAIWELGPHSEAGRVSMIVGQFELFYTAINSFTPHLQLKDGGHRRRLQFESREQFGDYTVFATMDHSRAMDMLKSGFAQINPLTDL
ncbi:MAG: hypothetical protein KW802_02270 [Candidatus Doudnabacteria bacterium]|nr:hypothetical protein [Candidatus Doudnabacteria bacterium]